MLLSVKNSGHENGSNTNKTSQSKMTANHESLPLVEKSDLMKFIGSMKFYSNKIDKLLVYMKPPYDSLLDNIKLHLMVEQEILFQQIKASITKVVFLTLP